MDLWVHSGNIEQLKMREGKKKQNLAVFLSKPSQVSQSPCKFAKFEIDGYLAQMKKKRGE